MKKALFLLPLTLLFLAGCGGQTVTPSSSGTTPTSSGDPKSTSNPDDPGDHDIRIKFYLDYNHYDKDNPYHSVWWDSNKTFTKEEIGLVDPTAPDPYYPTFLGWSKYAIVDEDDRLWNFGVDTISYDDTAGGIFEIFGIFIGK